MLKIGISRLLMRNTKYTPSYNQEKLIFNTYKHQGFRESLRPPRTFIKSAFSELNYLKSDENEFTLYLSSSSLTTTYSTNAIEINKHMTQEEENKVLDALIFRKNIVTTTFVEGFLSPLDTIIAEILKIEINKPDEIDDFMEKNGIISELKAYIIDKLKDKKSDQYDESIEKDEFLRIITDIDNI